MNVSNPLSAQGNSTSTSKENIGSTAEKVASAAHTAVDVAADNFAQAEKTLRETRVATGEKVIETAKQAQSYSQDALATVKTYIDLYPLRSMGIAVATGYLLSSLLKK